MAQARANAANNVVNKVVASAKGRLNQAAEHPKRKHVEENVRQVCVQEHVGKELVQLEVVGQEKVEPKERHKVYAPLLYYFLQQKHYDVGQQQIFGYYGDIVHK